MKLGGLWCVVIGAALYFAFLRMRGTITGPPWAPRPITARKP